MTYQNNPPEEQPAEEVGIDFEKPVEVEVYEEGEEYPYKERDEEAANMPVSI